MNSRFLIFLPLLALLSSCAAIPETSELRATAPDTNIMISGNWECLYQKGVEHLSKPNPYDMPFTWNDNRKAQSAWFRQALTLIELHAVSKGTTRVTQHQSSTPHLIGRGGDLIAYLKTNPCKSK